MNTQISEDDFFSPELSDVGHEQANLLRENFNRLLLLLDQQAEIAAAMETVTKEITELKGKTLPDLMREMGTDIYRDPETGKALELALAVNSSLPKDIDKRNAILSALRPLGIAEIMAEEFSMMFAPGDKRVNAIRYLLGTEPSGLIIDDEQEANEASELTADEMRILDGIKQTLGWDQLPATEKLGVHPSRFRSWLREQIEAGHGTEISDAGIWHGKVANVVEPKEKKGKKK